MGARVRCFWLSPTERAIESLRLFTYSGEECSTSKCPATSWGHDATAVVGEADYPRGDGRTGQGLDDLPHDDPRWPIACASCGVRFDQVERVEWQHGFQRLFSGAPDGKLYTLRNCPPGSMYDASWYPTKGPDGIALILAMPPGGGDDWWFVDGPASNGPGWTRTGTIPNVTARPSILTTRYHGFLTDGVLEEC